MAPESSKRGIVEEPENKSGFFDLLVHIPLVHSAVSTAGEFYSQTKSKNVVLSFALTMVESGCHVATNAAKPVATKFEKQIANADSYASDVLLKIEDRYPILKQPPNKVVQTSKKSVVKTSRSLLNSGPGQLFMRSLAKTIDVSENVLDYMLPQAEKNEEKRDEKPSTHDQPDDKDDTNSATTSSQTEQSVVQQIPTGKLVSLLNFARQVVSLPLQIWTDVLRRVYNYLLRISNGRSSRKSGASSPATIAKRTKKTPKKRIHAMSLLHQMLKYLPISNKAVQALGMNISRSSGCGDIRRYLILSPPAAGGEEGPVKPHDAERKRKHDETLTDSDISSDFDPETYRSSQDEDYSPSEECTTDSGEYESDEGDEKEREEEVKKLLEEKEETTGKGKDSGETEKLAETAESVEEKPTVEDKNKPERDASTGEGSEKEKDDESDLQHQKKEIDNSLQKIGPEIVPVAETRTD